MCSGPDSGSIPLSEELRAITARWFDAYSRGDAEACLARISRMRGTTAWGTDVGEFFDDSDLLRRFTVLDFGARELLWTFGPLQIDAWAEGPVGWAIVRGEILLETGPQEVRSTQIYHLEHDEWKLVHGHWSFPSTGDEYGGGGRSLELMAQAAADEHPDLGAWTSDSGTTTLAFTDIEGSTALNASFGDAAWLSVLRVHNELVTAATSEHGGTVVKNQGDGFMLAFPSARRAVACAQAIEQSIADTFDDPGSPIRVRIGIHTGEVTADEDDFFGHAVNYAARVAAAASGGEILVSTVVHELVAPTGLFAFGDAREVTLKGIADVAWLYPLATSKLDH